MIVPWDTGYDTGQSFADLFTPVLVEMIRSMRCQKYSWRVEGEEDRPAIFSSRHGGGDSRSRQEGRASAYTFDIGTARWRAYLVNLLRSTATPVPNPS